MTPLLRKKPEAEGLRAGNLVIQGCDPNNTRLATSALRNDVSLATVTGKMALNCPYGTIRILSSGTTFSYSLHSLRNRQNQGGNPFNVMLQQKDFIYEEYVERCNMFQATYKLRLRYGVSAATMCIATCVLDAGVCIKLVNRTLTAP